MIFEGLISLEKWAHYVSVFLNMNQVEGGRHGGKDQSHTWNQLH